MNEAFRLTTRIKLYTACGGQKTIEVCGDWSIIDLSHHYPVCSATGFDDLLYFLPEAERDNVTIEFYDSNGNPTGDPRIYLEDLPD